MSLLNIITSAILYRHVENKAELGIWFVFIQTFTFIDTFRTGFLQTAFIKFFAGAEKERAARILGSTWLIGLLTTFAVCAITLPGLLFLGARADQSLLTIAKW